MKRKIVASVAESLKAFQIIEELLCPQLTAAICMQLAMDA